MKEILEDFDDKENNNILNNNTENIYDNNLNKKEKTNYNPLLEYPKRGSIADLLESHSFSASYSSLSEEEKDRSKYITFHNCKDFLIMLSLLMCPSFNFNYLYLPILLIGFYYIKLILKNTNEQKRKKTSFETIILVYSFLLIIFKVIIIALAKKKYNSILNNKSIYIDLGISYLLEDGIFDVIKTFIGESIIIICCIFTIIQS